jgi:hypothetical protein
MVAAIDILRQSRAESRGYSSTVDMQTGQAGPSPGPRVWFKRRDVETKDMVGDAATYTVRFGVNPPASTNTGEGGFSNYGFRCVARIHWKVAGNVITRVIDVDQGTSITGVCEGVDIDLQDITPPGTNVPSGIPYRVTVQIAQGMRPTYISSPTLEATATFLNGAPSSLPGVIGINHGGSAIYPIPTDVGVIAAEVTAIGTGLASTDVVAVFGNSVYESKNWLPLQQPGFGFILVPPNSTYLAVLNNSGSASASVSVTWGIEG